MYYSKVQIIFKWILCESQCYHYPIELLTTASFGLIAAGFLTEAHGGEQNALLNVRQGGRPKEEECPRTTQNPGHSLSLEMMWPENGSTSDIPKKSTLEYKQDPLLFLAQLIP